MLSNPHPARAGGEGGEDFCVAKEAGALTYSQFREEEEEEEEEE
jgi:hypothetical protein